VSTLSSGNFTDGNINFHLLTSKSHQFITQVVNLLKFPQIFTRPTSHTHTHTHTHALWTAHIHNAFLQQLTADTGIYTTCWLLKYTK